MTVACSMVSFGSCVQVHHGATCPRTMAVHDCHNRFVRWRRANIWDQIMEALAASHDAAVQMIDTSVVRVHQHGACIAHHNHQDKGSFRESYSCKIPTGIDTNSMPVPFPLTTT